ncbi:hypothetical protein [Leptolyngbya iicbica]|uniref:Uncharacterized protein n=2 Tax=Cyanophyceae TaxID=3028117 RepID=A0A4Q7E997_9CYAN|nr:hypothetical protein [Leptolyngbya sp. LK]RZM78969.1 hypothetical protein DYY88_09325 [Leptolyngbya sp. LK]
MTHSSDQSPSTLQLAQQGNPQAIAALLNQSLKSDGVKAKVARQGDRLKIALLGKTPPDPVLCQRITAGIKRLQITDINHCQISAYQVNQRQPIWSETLTLAQPNSSRASATAQPTKASPGVPTSQKSAQSSVLPASDRPAKLSTFAFWKRGIAFLLSIPLIVHGSLRFLLTLETMFFGWKIPQQMPLLSIQSIPLLTNLLLHFLGRCAASALALGLGLLAIRYALQSHRSIAKKLSIGLAIAPALFVVLCIITNPYFILPSPTMGYANEFYHSVTGAPMGRGFQLILIGLNILLLVIGGTILYRGILRSQSGQKYSFWKELKQSFLQLWDTRKRDVLTLSAVGLLLLCLTNPGPVRHLKVDYLGDFWRIGSGNSITADDSVLKETLANSDDVHYRTLLVCSWLSDRQRGRITFGVAGHTYDRKVGGLGDSRRRFDLLNPSNYFKYDHLN